MRNIYDSAYTKWRNGVCRSRALVPVAAIAALMCASISPVNATGAMPVTSVAEAAYFIKVASHLDYRYRKVVKNGVVYYCKRETVTGSRLERNEVCLTEKQRKKLEDESQQQLRNMQNQAQDPNITPNIGPGT